MARIKHVAYIVEDLEKTGAFFEDLVGFRRAGHIRRAGNYPGSALDLTDGEINLTLLCPDPDVERRPWAYGTFGPNHIGIETDRAAEIHQARASRRRTLCGRCPRTRLLQVQRPQRRGDRHLAAR